MWEHWKRAPSSYSVRDSFLEQVTSEPAEGDIAEAEADSESCCGKMLRGALLGLHMALVGWNRGRWTVGLDAVLPPFAGLMYTDD